MRILWATLLIFTMLAGCSDDAPPTEAADPVDFTEYELEATPDTGILRGVVVDTAIVPVMGAVATLDPSGLEQTTNDGGAFGFDGLEPGFYTLTISKEGYAPTQQTAQVVAGDAAPPVVKVRIVEDPTTAPYVETFVFDGLIGCSIRSPVIGFAACGLPGLEDATGNIFLQHYTFDRIAEQVQSEMVWRPTQETGNTMELSWDDLSGDNQVEIRDEAGTSPVVTKWGRPEFEALNLTGREITMRVFSADMEGTDVVDDELYQGPYRDSVYGTVNGTGLPSTVDPVFSQCVPLTEYPCANNPFGEDCVEYAALFASCFGIGGAGLLVDQPYSVYTNAFYNFMPDEDWLFVEDGHHAQP